MGLVAGVTLLLALVTSGYAQSECVLVSGLTNHPTGNGYYEQDTNLMDCDNDGFNRYKHISQNVYMWAKASSTSSGIWVISEVICLRQTYYAKTGLDETIINPSVLEHNVDWKQSDSTQTAVDANAASPTVIEVSETARISGLTNNADANGVYNLDNSQQDCGGDGFSRYVHATGNYFLWGELFNNNGAWEAHWVVSETICSDATWVMKSTPSGSMLLPSVHDRDSASTWIVADASKTAEDTSAAQPTVVNESPCSAGSVSGDPHYKTLDGLRFNFQGSCSYIMSQYTGPELTPFKIVVKMWQWDDKPTYPRNMHITFGRHSVYLFQQNYIRVNKGDTIQPPYYHQDFSITWNGNNSVLETDFGLHIEWSGRYKSILKIPHRYAGKVSGLLGNYDGIPDNDLVKPDGTTGTVCEVGEAWQTRDAGCKSTCYDNNLRFEQNSYMKKMSQNAKFSNPFKQFLKYVFE